MPSLFGKFGLGSSEILVLATALSLYGTVLAEEGGAVIISEKDDEFSIPAFVIGVRESIEGCVIVAVLLNALHKSGQHHMKKWVWFGVIVGTVSFMIAGAVCLIIFYAIGEAMPQQGKAAFEGVLALVACAILTQISFKFLRLKDLIMKWEGKLVQDKSNVAPDSGAVANTTSTGVWASFLYCIADFRDALNIRHQSIDRNAQGELSWKVIVTITVSALFREGLETVIFLLPISSTTSEVGLVTGAIAGIVVGIAFGILVLVVGKYFLLDPTWFFNATTVFIFFIAAGLATYSVIELEQIGASQLKAENHPVLYRPVYNIGCLHSSQGRLWRGVVDTKCFLTEATGYDEFGKLRESNVGFIFRALLGYRATPTISMCIAYCLYWMVVSSIMIWRYKQGTLFSKMGQVELKELSVTSSTIAPAGPLTAQSKHPVTYNANLMYSYTTPYTTPYTPPIYSSQFQPVTAGPGIVY
jgi:high-affinity iron transporter